MLVWPAKAAFHTYNTSHQNGFGKKGGNEDQAMNKENDASPFQSRFLLHTPFLSHSSFFFFFPSSPSPVLLFTIPPLPPSLRPSSHRKTFLAPLEAG